MDDFAVVIVIGFLLVAIIGVALGAGYVVERTSCMSAYENYSPSYGLFSGCRIVVDGVVTPIDIVREMK